MPLKNKEERKKDYRRWFLEHKEERKKYNKEWRKKNRDRLSKYNKQWQKNNPEKVKKYYQRHEETVIKWQKNNPEKVKLYRRRCYLNNPGYYRQRYQEHKDVILKYIRQYNQEHKKERNEYTKNKYKTDLKTNLNCKISIAMRRHLKDNKNGRKWESLVSYTLNDLIKRLKKTIPMGYTWDDILTGKLHIDHIIPKLAFNFSKPEHTDFKRCWALSNLRLLPAKENHVKHAKLNSPFQPALRI